jgi:hypothetical protein
MTTQGMSTGTNTGNRAEELKGTVTEQSGQVAGTAKEQAKEVASEATERGRDLAREARSQVRDQADAQRERLAGTLHQLGDELRSMAGGNEGPGVATELARQAADRVHGLGDYVERHQPGDVLDEVRAFARRRPGTFLVAAAAAGVLAGRLTRGVKAAASSDDAGASGGPYGGPGTSGDGYTRGTGPASSTMPSATPASTPASTPTTTPTTTSTAPTTGTAGTGPVHERVDVIAVEAESEGSARRFRGELP